MKALRPTLAKGERKAFDIAVPFQDEALCKRRARERKPMQAPGILGTIKQNIAQNSMPNNSQSDNQPRTVTISR
jgi:hypothetical protein